MGVNSSGAWDSSDGLGQTARMDTKAPNPPSGTPMTLVSRRETLIVQQGFRNWKTPTLGAHVQVHDGSGSRITLTRVVGLGVLAGGFRKATGHVTIVVIGRDGQTAMVKVKVKPKKAQEILSWAFEFNAWNEAWHRADPALPPYPPTP